LIKIYFKSIKSLKFSSKWCDKTNGWNNN